jgi:hypothetical protein
MLGEVRLPLDPLEDGWPPPGLLAEGWPPPAVPGEDWLPVGVPGAGWPLGNSDGHGSMPETITTVLPRST